MLVPLDLAQAALLLGAGFLAGAVNSIAGGGSLLTFALLLLFGVTPLHANATSTLALVPGSVSSLWGFRSSLDREGRFLLAVGLASLIGAVLGAFLLLRVGEVSFSRVAPWLILAATVLFMVQGPLLSWLRSRRAGREEDVLSATSPSQKTLLVIFFVQLGIAIYGGFFGSGMGILMLAAFGLVGLTSIHRMNALKHLAAVLINGLAALIFVRNGCVDWAPALLIAVAAIVGGYAGARAALWVGAVPVRRAIMVINLSIAAFTFWRLLRHG